MKPTRSRKPLFERLREGLEEGIRHAKGEIPLKTTTVELPDRPPAIAAKELTSLRKKSGMSQSVFARLLNVSPKTVQSWEQGQRRPSQAALRLIQVYRHDPASLLEMVGMSRLAERRRLPVNREADLF
jgi:putative transcriptional regulator